MRCVRLTSGVSSVRGASAVQAKRRAVAPRVAPLASVHRQLPLIAQPHLVHRGGVGSLTIARAIWDKKKESVPALKEIMLQDMKQKDVPLSNYLGKVLLVVNVASQCGFTASNYKELVEMYSKYQGKGLEILAFPCNQFGKQEPGSNEEIMSFTKKYGVEFPVFDKVDVNGRNTHPFFTYLKEKAPSGGLLGKDTKWNFEKFLVDKEGNVVKRYRSTTSPAAIEKDIEKIL